MLGILAPERWNVMLLKVKTAKDAKSAKELFF